MSATGTSDRPMRADARRNHDRLLAAARSAFTEQGPDVPLEEIARLAGLGIGTLYRHFPTRQALLEAVYREEMTALAQRAHELLKALPAGEATAAWLAEAAAYASGRLGLVAAMRESLEDRSELFTFCHARLWQAADALLSCARRQGVLRHEVAPDHLLSFAYAAAVAAECSRESGERLLAVLMDGLVTSPSP